MSNPVRGHNEVRKSTGYTHDDNPLYSNKQGFKAKILARLNRFNHQRISESYQSHVVGYVIVFFTLTDWASTIPSNIYVVASPVRGLLDKKRSEEHIRQSSNESKKQNKNGKNKGTITKYTCQKKIEERHSKERVW